MSKRIKAYIARLVGPGLLALGLALSISVGAQAASVHVTGTVTNQNGQGIQNVGVTATAPGAVPVDYGPSFTEADGSYTLDVDPGTYDFHFTPPSGSGLNPVVYSNFTVMTDQVLNVTAVPPTHTFSGTIINADGSPANDVTVRLYGRNDENHQYSAQVDAAGGYSFTVQSDRYELQIRPSNGKWALISPQTASYDLRTSDATQDIQIPPFATLYVIAKDAQGNPVSGATAYATGRQQPNFIVAPGVVFDAISSNSGITGADGKAALSVLKGTDYGAGDVAVVYPGADPAPVYGQTAVSTDNGDATVTIQAPLTYTFSGAIVDDLGSPASGIQVRAQGSSNPNHQYATTTDILGRYSFTVQPDTYNLQISAANGKWTLFSSDGAYNLTTSSATQNIQIPEFTNLTVIAKNASGGLVSGATAYTIGRFQPGFMVAPGVAFYGASGNSAQTNSSGEATVSVMKGTMFGAGDVGVQFPGDATLTYNTVPITTANGATSVTIQALATYTISGHVIDAAGAPAADITVRLYGRNDENHQYTAQVDALGNYSIVVQPDRYQLQIRPSSGKWALVSPETASYDLRNGDATQNIRIPPFTNLNVVAQDVNGNPVMGATAYATGRFQPGFIVAPGVMFDGVSSDSRQTDAEGRAALSVMKGSIYGVHDIAVQYPSEGGVLVLIYNTTSVDTSSGEVTVLFQPQPATPDAPTGLSATTPTANAPALTWNTASGAANYRIFRDGTQIGTTTAPNFVDSALATSGSYSYTIQSVNTNGATSAGSAPFLVVYDIDAPAVTGVSVVPATIVTGDSSTLSASVSDAFTGVATGEYFEGTDPGQGNGTTMNVASGTATIAVGSSLAAGTHIFAVRAQDGVGNWSVPITVELTVRLAAPDGLQAASPTNNPVLSWTAVAGTDHYDIYRDGGKVGTAATTTYTDAAATSGSHTYYVVALTAADIASDLSGTITVIVDKTRPTITYTVAPAPNAAGWNGRANVNPANTGGVTVTFACGDGAGGSQIQSCTTPQTVTTDGDNQTVTGTAVDNAGNSSSVAATIRLDRAAPAAGPLSWSSNPLPRGSNTTLTVPATDALSGVASGEYFIGADPGTGNGTALTLGTGQLTTSFGATLAAGTYTVGARSRDNAGNWSAVATGQLVVTLPAPVITGGPQLIVTNRRPTLTWNAVPGAATYRVYRNGTLISGTNITGTTYTDNAGTSTNPNGVTTYRYNLVAVTAGGTAGPQSSNYLIGVLPAGNTLTVTGTVLPVAPEDLLPNFVAGRQANFTLRATNQNNIMQPAAFSFIYGTGAAGYSVNATSLQWVSIDPVNLTATVQGLANTRVGNGVTTSRAFRVTIDAGNPQHVKLDVFNSTSFTTVQYHVDRDNSGDVIDYR